VLVKIILEQFINMQIVESIYREADVFVDILRLVVGYINTNIPGRRAELKFCLSG
jgi:hypothetical protein